MGGVEKENVPIAAIRFFQAGLKLFFLGLQQNLWVN
jgi:hypothetical protein